MALMNNRPIAVNDGGSGSHSKKDEGRFKPGSAYVAPAVSSAPSISGMHALAYKLQQTNQAAGTQKTAVPSAPAAPSVPAAPSAPAAPSVPAAPAITTPTIAAPNLPEIPMPDYSGLISEAEKRAAALEEMYTKGRTDQESRVEKIRNSAIEALMQQYNSGVGSVNETADNAQRENYISSKIAHRNLGQQLAAQGLTGGASETTALGLANQYGSNRAATERGRADNLTVLADTLAQNKAGVEQSYQSQLGDIASTFAAQIAAARNQAAQERASLLMSQYEAQQNVAMQRYNAELAQYQLQQEAEIARQQLQQEAALAQYKAQLSANASGSNGGNPYKDLGVGDNHVYGYSVDLANVMNGNRSRRELLEEADGLMKMYGSSAYAYLLQNAK